ncbi:MAG TPA: molybdopterin-dependent oxidoreductase [Candidatus Acidoferrum sp.]|nr:molybdopterin-dependent oxidoreductase [Candidatus Acidoferrum sp.]
MVDGIHRIVLLAILPCALGIISPGAQSVSAQTSPAPAQLKIGGAVSAPVVLTVADLKNMPRKTISVTNPHEKKVEVYEGVPLEELLRRAGAPQGEKLRGPLMASYVVAEADDGYRVVFSLAELDSAFLDSEVLVADTMDGAPLGPKQGPFRLVAPHEKRPARWVRMLKSITVVGPQE